MMPVLKFACLAVYALGLAGFAGLVHGPWASGGEILTIAFLGVHALELLVAFKYLHLYRGPLAASVALAMLFGLFHWAPLARQAKAAKP